MGYANCGRRPKPTALKLLLGNPGKGKPNLREPKAAAGEVMRPEGLSRQAAAVWDELAPMAIAMGVLTRSDIRAFRTLCELQATLDTAATQKDRPRFTPVDAAGEFHPAVRLEKTYAPIIRHYYAMFGLEPASRSRIVVTGLTELPQSKWAEIGLL